MAGIAFLRRLLMKQAMKKSKDASGIMSLNKNLVNDVETQVAKWVDSAKKQGQDIDKMGEQEIKYIVELNKPKAAPHTLEELVEKLGLNDPKKNKFLQKEGEVIDMTGKKIDTSQPILGGKNVPEVSGIDKLLKSDFNKAAGVTDVITDTVTKIKIMEPVAAMKEANLVVGRKGIYKNLTQEQSQKILKDTDDWIFQRDPDDLYDYNKKRPFRDDPDPEDFAHGGRTGSGLNYLLGEDDQNSRVPYASGSRKKSWTDRIAGWTGGANVMAGEAGLETWDLLNNLLQSGGLYAEGGRTGFGIGGLSRRAFLKLMGGAAAGTAAAKSGLLSIFKGGATKSVIKDLASVPIKDISGMPVWFKPLVNRVIKEGDDVTKKFGTVDREIVHKTKLPDSQTDVIVTQDLTTGDVVVDIGMGKHGFKEGHLGQPVRLEYKAAEDIMAGPDMDAMFKVGERDPHIKVKSRDEMTFDQKKYPDKKPEEFWVEEAEFTGGHPENVKFEETISEKFGQHGSNFDEVEKFATGTVKKTKKTESRVFGKKYLSEGDDMASGGRVPLADGKKVADPGYFKFQASDEDRPSRYGYDASTPEKMEKVKEELERMKKELIEQGIIEQKTFSEADKMPTENNFLEAMQNPFPKNTPEELEEFERNLRLKQELKGGGRVPLAEGSTPSAEQLQQYYEEIEKQKKRERLQEQLYEQRFGGHGPVLEAASGGIAGMLGE